MDTDAGRVPPGPGWVAEPDPKWRAVQGRECRRLIFLGAGRTGVRRSCRAPSVAETDRGLTTSRGHQSVWWPYCAEHLYERWVEGDTVYCWVRETVQLGP